MRMYLMAVLGCVACNSVSAPRIWAQSDESSANETTLITKSDEYLVHIVRIQSESGAFAQFFEEPKMALLHTSLRTGKMIKLYVSGDFTRRSLPMGIDRVYHSSKRLVGVAVSKSFIFTVCWETSATELLMGDRQQKPKFDKGKFFLNAFEITTGKKLASTEIKGESLTKSQFSPKALMAKDKRVEFFDRIYAFDGKDFIKQEKSSK